MWSISIRMDKHSLKWARSRSRDLFKFWEIVDISEMLQKVQDRDMIIMED